MSLISVANRLQECRITLERGDARIALETLREALQDLVEGAPIAWTGSGRDYKSKIGDFLKKGARDTLGINGKARKDAQGAYKHGQDALAQSAKSDKDAEKYAQHGDINRAVGAHNGAVKSQQAAMAGFKHTMDRANKEGDRETADWAARAGAVHTSVRAHHMGQGSALRQWATGKQKAIAGHVAQAAAAHTAQKVAAGSPGKSNFASSAYRDHMSKVATSAHARASNTAGSTPFSSAPAGAPPAAPSAAAPPTSATKPKMPRRRRAKVGTGPGRAAGGGGFPPA